MVESAKKVKKNSFGLLELEMADLKRFWRKTPLGPLGVNSTGVVISNHQTSKFRHFGLRMLDIR
jgi:hypothetical protein